MAETAPDLLANLLALAEAEAAPATREQLMDAGVLLSGLPSQKGAGLDAQNALRVFAIGLRDMPASLLDKAVERACRECTFRPSPAELRALVAADLAESARRLARLREAAR